MFDKTIDILVSRCIEIDGVAYAPLEHVISELFPWMIVAACGCATFYFIWMHVCDGLCNLGSDIADAIYRKIRKPR